ncbi:MAG: ABC transporter ATP-binding protein, partial [Pseudomonadota bacterium]
MLLTVKDVTKAFPGDPPVDVLRGVSLELEAGESLALTGESGSGKSTLLHIIGGLEVADGGSVTLEGTELVGLPDTALAEMRRRDIGVIFQQFNLIPSLTIRDNLTFHARLGGRADSAWTTALAEALGLDGLLSRYPEQLRARLSRELKHQLHHPVARIFVKVAGGFIREHKARPAGQ